MGAASATWAGPNAWVLGATLFAASLAIRLLFIHATPDAAWAYSAAFKGDALLWLDYARGIQTGIPFELGLPLHPPGTAYLIAWLWDGTAAGLPFLRATWALFGAVTVVLLWLAASRAFGPMVGLLAGVLAALSTGLIVLSSSVNSEAPYLLLVVASFLVLEPLGSRSRRPAAVAWGLLGALACLIRVEHVLAFAFITGWLTWRGWHDGRQRQMLAALSLAGACFALFLLPWHIHVWRAIQDFNITLPAEAPGQAAALATIEARTAFLSWDPGATEARNQLPAFARRTASAFVAATVAHRGGERVEPGDFRILDQAFGGPPRPLTRLVFVSTYGPLNFALANHPTARGGFSRAALDDPPPLADGRNRYPPELISSSPPDLTLAYPPHARLMSDGYRLGASWIAEDPARFGGLLARKLAIFGSGGTLGFTGYGIPLGASGLRRAVDMVTPPSGWGSALWSLLALSASALGVARSHGRPLLLPWMLYALSKLVVTCLFFGYARQGVLILPVVVVLMSLAIEPWVVRNSRRVTGVLLALVAFGAVLETARFLRPPQVLIDGLAIRATDPTPADLFRDQLVEYR